jgi:P4 family phage/plasmid primase-like protien
MAYMNNFTYTQRYSEITDMAVRDLISGIDKNGMEIINNIRGFSEKSAALCRYLRQTFRSGKFGMYKGEIYFFTGRIYEQCPTFVFRDIVSRFLDGLGVSAAIIMKYGDNRFYREAYYGVCYNALQPSFHLMAFRNCVVDMRTLRKYPFDHRLHCVYLHDYDFDMNAECPTWKRFLKRVLPDNASRQILQMYLSLGLVDRNNSEMKVENCLCCYGTGSNGKSVVFETICGLFGRENVGMASLESILCRKGDESLRAAASVDGKRFLYCSEVGRNVDIGDNGSMFKRFVSGEPMQGRLLKQNEYTVYNIPYLVMNLNSRVTTSDCSNAILRRFIELDFPVTISDDEKDLGLVGKIAEEYSGVMAWLVRGMQNFKASGYRFPESKTTQLNKFKTIAKNDSLYAWVQLKKMRIGTGKYEKGNWFKCADLYANYIEFCEENALNDMTIMMFGRRMQRMGFERRKQGGIVFYVIYGDVDLNYVPMVNKKDCYDLPAVEVVEEVY